MSSPIDFILNNWPSTSLILKGLPLSMLLAFLILLFAGLLRKHGRWKHGYTRKVFHFGIFTSAALIQSYISLGGVFVFGVGVSLIIFLAIYMGKGNILYEAIARKKDEPHRTYYIIVPYLATLIGGLTLNFLFAPEAAVCGYLVAGLGDAAGEPIGTRYGVHKYRVPSRKGVKIYRTFEGSAGVLVVSIIAVLIALFLRTGDVVHLHPNNLLMAGFVAFCCTCVEALSPHGWDNFTMQVGGGLFWTILIV